MFALGVLQGSPDASLTWLLDVLLAFMVVVVVVGSLVESRLQEQNQKSQEEKPAIKVEPSPNSKSIPRTRGSRSSKRRSK